MRQLKTGARDQGWSEDEELTIFISTSDIYIVLYFLFRVRDVVVC